MTAAFDEFLRQYKMTGSEKADGYSRDAFLGLEGHEKEEVFGLLVHELPHSVDWLFFVDAKKAFHITKEREKALRGNGYIPVYMLQKELVKYSGGLTYQNHMIEDYPSYTDRLRSSAVKAVADTPLSKVAIDFFRQVIMTETHIDAVTRAALALLHALRIPRDTELEKKKYKQLKDDLRSENVQVKLNALTYLARHNTDPS